MSTITVPNAKWPVRASQRSAFVFYAKQLFNLAIYIVLGVIYTPYLETLILDEVTRSMLWLGGYLILALLVLLTIGRIIWQYMVIRSRRLSFEGSMLILSQGIFNTREDQIHTRRIRDFQVRCTFIQRCFGIGDLTILSIDRTIPVLEMRGIPDPKAYKQYLASQVTVRAGEMEMVRPEMDHMEMDDVEHFEGDSMEMGQLATA